MQAYKNMDMIGHSVNCQQLVPSILDDSSYVFMKFLFARLADEIGPAFYGEDDLDV